MSHVQQPEHANLNLVRGFYEHLDLDKPIRQSWVREKSVPYDPTTINYLFKIPAIHEKTHLFLMLISMPLMLLE